MNLARSFFLRLLAAVYFAAFWTALAQFPALLGEHGLLPVTAFMRQIPFSETPSLFYWFYSDDFLRIVSIAGMAISIGLFLGVLERGPWWLTTVLWLVLYVLYLSIVNVGQAFYS